MPWISIEQPACLGLFSRSLSRSNFYNVKVGSYLPCATVHSMHACHHAALPINARRHACITHANRRHAWQRLLPDSARCIALHRTALTLAARGRDGAQPEVRGVGLVLGALRVHAAILDNIVILALILWGAVLIPCVEVGLGQLGDLAGGEYEGGAVGLLGVQQEGLAGREDVHVVGGALSGRGAVVRDLQRFVCIAAQAADHSYKSRLLSRAASNATGYTRGLKHI